MIYTYKMKSLSFLCHIPSSSPMAAAALLSLARSLHQILNQENYIDPLHKEKLVSLHEKVDSVASFLQDYSDKCGGTLDLAGNGIKEAAYEAQDFMDSYLRSVSTTDVDSSSSKSCNEASVDQGLNMALERINFIWEEVMKMKNRDKAEDLPSRTHSSPVDHSSKVKITAPNIVVGFEDDLKAIEERLYEDSAKLEIIPIVGMGGLGKTTLARKAYDDSLLGQYFDICAWITLSAEYQRREILTRLLQSFKKSTDDLDENLNESEAQLAIFVYQKLLDRRYLIVIDDIWSTKAWDDLKMIFPDNSNGSRILLTTRISGVAVHAGSSSTRLHKMDFLDEDRSWKLLGERIFGQESCPPQLMEIGKKIARSCGGLPLTIVVVAGLILSTGDIMKQELWENISENISSVEPTIELQCSKILCLSYDRLPLGLKPCFLYITAFPEDHEIDVSKLIMLWVAEGFLEQSDRSKCLEDVGEQYLEDLGNRSLILVSQRGPNGNLETVGIHDLLREICMVKAKEEGFFHLASSKRNAQKDAGEKPNRCINIHCPQVFQEWQIEDSSVYSVLLFYDKLLYSRLSPSCWHLTILDASELTRQNFPDLVSTFVNLRYIAIASSDMQCTYDFVVSLSKLPNLQTIILHDSRFSAPDEIWEMPKLRHLIAGALFYSSCPNIRIDHKSDLQTLETVFNLRFTDEFIKIFVNLKKLKVVFDEYADQRDHFNLNNLFRLQHLEELEVATRDIYSSVLWDHAFPTSLKKLTLEGVAFPWKNMTMIGSLPHLQVLQVTESLLSELSEWAPIEGQFLRLKYLRSSLNYLERWEVEKEHFPSLESLVLEYVISIDEIPCGIGEIDSLQLIELRYCERSLVNSAKLIQEQQREYGNYAFQIRFIKCYE